mmetsp:Transcript_61243/g.164743  ORF Transcript_61243/g.164743 Transcript_61243/m.164743 type:complete len:260 (+) Transcript_61243:1106-1885(+)
MLCVKALPPHLKQAMAPSPPIKSPMSPEAPHSLHCHAGRFGLGAGLNAGSAFFAAVAAENFARRSSRSFSALSRMTLISSMRPGSCINFCSWSLSLLLCSHNFAMSLNFFCKFLNRFSVSSSISRPMSPGGGANASARACVCRSSGPAGSSGPSPAGPAGAAGAAFALAFTTSTGGGVYSSPRSTQAISLRNSTSDAILSFASQSRSSPLASLSLSFSICCNFFLMFLMRFSCSAGESPDEAPSSAVAAGGAGAGAGSA